MPYQDRIMTGAKLPGAAAAAIAGSVGTFTGAGTVTGDATTLTADICACDGGSNSGVKLQAGKAGDRVVVGNIGANTVKLYPPTGGKLNGGSADAAESLATTTCATAYFYTNIDAIVVLGA